MLEQNPIAAAGGFARVTRQSVVFAVGSVAGKVVGLALLPVLTRLLTPAEFGRMDVLQSLGSALTVPLLLGLDVATLRLYFDQPDQTARRTLVGTSYAMVLGTTLLVGALVTVGSGAVSTALFAGSQLQPAVVAVAVSVVGGAVQVITLTVLRAQGRAGTYAALLSATSFLYAILAVALLVVWRADANAVLVGYAASVIAAALAGTFVVRQEALGGPARRAGRALLRLGLPMVPAATAAVVADFINRAILLDAAGAAAVAYFGIAVRFGSVAGLVAGSFRLSWVPRGYALGTSAEGRVRLARDAHWIVAIICVSVTLIAVASPEIVELAAGPQYVAALSPLAFYLVAVLFGTLGLVVSLPIAVGMAMQNLAIASLANSGVSLACNLILAAPMGATGTAIAIAAGGFAEVVILAKLGTQWMPLPVDWVRLGGSVLIVGLAVVALLASNVSLLGRIAVGSMVLVIIAWSVPSAGALRTLLAGIKHVIATWRG